MVACTLACADSATRTPPSARIRASAERRLRSNSYLALRNLSCDWHEGVLVLWGCLPTYYLKQVAQAAVAPLEGVERIENRIRVVPPASRSRQDEAGDGLAEQGRWRSDLDRADSAGADLVTIVPCEEPANAARA
jgi:hypothetical protein